MKAFSLVFMLCVALAAPARAAVGEPVRVVLLVHGWNGSADSFGQLPRMLAAEQAGLWPAAFFEVQTIAFKAPRPDATLIEQCAACGTQIERALAGVAEQFPGRPREVYFITHSMGGLILRRLWLDHQGKSDPLGAAFADLKVAILVAPPNQGSDEVRFATYQLEKSLSGLTADLLGERSLKSLANKAVGAMIKGIPLEQAYNMAAGSDFIESLNVAWGKAGACEKFPGWILAGAHDVVVDLANANINTLSVGPDALGRTQCARTVVDPARVRYYPYNHSNTNRRDGILGSIESADHPVFADIAKLLTGKPLAPMTAPSGPSKLFLRFRHPAGDRVTDVSVEPFEGALKEASAYELGLPDGKVVGFRQQDFVVIAGMPAALLPVQGGTVLTVKVKAERKGILPALVPYLPKLMKSQLDWGPQNIVRSRTFQYRPVKITIPDGALSSNSVLSLTVPLAESPIDLPDAAVAMPGGCSALEGEPAERARAARESLANRDTDDLARQLRRLGGTQDPALVELLASFSGETYPPPIRRAAVAALGDLRAPAAFATLKPLVSDAEPTVRALALDALGRVPAEAAVDVLVEVLAKPGDARTERAAVAGLSQAAEPLLRAAIDHALDGAPEKGRRSRVCALALTAGESTPELISAVARQALAVTEGRAAPDPYGRILDMLIEHASPDDRTWLRRMRKAAGQAEDATWTKRLLAQVAERGRPSGAPAIGEE